MEKYNKKKNGPFFLSFSLKQLKRVFHFNYQFQSLKSIEKEKRKKDTIDNILPK